jgi:hypothetical protein
VQAPQPLEEIIADKGYHSNQTMIDLEAVGVCGELLISPESAIRHTQEQSVHSDEDQPVDVSQPQPRPGLAAQDDHLLPQNQIFSLEPRP